MTDRFTQSSEDPTTQAVEAVRQQVEEALQFRFNPIFPSQKHFASALSTDPTRVSQEVNNKSLNGKCGEFSIALKSNLKDGSLPVSLNVARYHISLVSQTAGVEVLIDPTLGQFLYGYNHVFVGTRNQLRNLIMGHQYPILQVNPGESREEFFRRMWEPEEPFLPASQTSMSAKLSKSSSVINASKP